jgi:hypothetical protein
MVAKVLRHRVAHSRGRPIELRERGARPARARAAVIAAGTVTVAAGGIDGAQID